MISRPSSRSTSSTRSAGCTQVGPPARRCRGHPVAVGHHVGADLGQPALRGAFGVVDAGGAVGQVDGHADRRLRPVVARRVTAPVGQRGFDCAAGDIGQQRGGPVQCRHRDGRVDGAFVAAARLAGQVQPALGARHRGGIPHRGLQQHVGGGVAHLGGARAHDAADGRGRDVVDDQHVAGVELALDVVERDDRLPRLGEPHVEAAGDQAAVVGVHRVTELEHHVVRDVDGGRDGADAAQQQPPLHPPRRHRGRVDAGHRAQRRTG